MKKFPIEIDKDQFFDLYTMLDRRNKTIFLKKFGMSLILHGECYITKPFYKRLNKFLTGDTEKKILNKIFKEDLYYRAGDKFINSKGVELLLVSHNTMLDVCMSLVDTKNYIIWASDLPASNAGEIKKSVFHSMFNDLKKI